MSTTIDLVFAAEAAYPVGGRFYACIHVTSEAWARLMLEEPRAGVSMKAEDCQLIGYPVVIDDSLPLDNPVALMPTVKTKPVHRGHRVPTPKIIRGYA